MTTMRKADGQSTKKGSNMFEYESYCMTVKKNQTVIQFDCPFLLLDFLGAVFFNWKSLLNWNRQFLQHWHENIATQVHLLSNFKYLMRHELSIFESILGPHYFWWKNNITVVETDLHGHLIKLSDRFAKTFSATVAENRIQNIVRSCWNKSLKNVKIGPGPNHSLNSI